jgi:hypothetical protein
MARHRQQENRIESLRRVRDFKALQRWFREEGIEFEIRGRHAAVVVDGVRIPLACTPGGGNRAVMNMRADILRVLR